MDEEAAAETVGGSDETAHFCKAPTEAEVESWRQHWRREYEESHPRQTPPPMRNVDLALEIAGDGIREYTFRGTIYRLKPTPFTAGLQLSRVEDVLGLLQGIGSLTGQDELLALRSCYATIAKIGGELLVPSIPDNPFLADGEQEDLHRLLHFLLSTGDETPPAESDGGTPRAWNAAHYLLAYETAFGPPTTWRKFCAGLACLRRVEAERALQLHGAILNAIGAAFGGEEQRQEWIAAQRQDAR